MGLEDKTWIKPGKWTKVTLRLGRKQGPPRYTVKNFTAFVDGKQGQSDWS